MNDNAAKESLAMREKFWDELDADGKTERMREYVLRLMTRVDHLESKIRRLMKHQHLDGKIVVLMLDDWNVDESGVSHRGRDAARF